MIGVKKREGIEGTDIFYRLGLLTTAAALPGEIVCTTEIGLMIAPDILVGLFFLVILFVAEDN